METSKQKTIDTLNNLLEINNDRVEGYNTASEETDDSDLKGLFSRLSATSTKCQEELSSAVTRLGGKPVEGTRTTGKLYRAWMDIRAALATKERKAILKSCETGEDVAKKNYEEALEETSLDTDIRSLIEEQYESLKKDHDEVKNLRDALVDV